MSKWEVEKDKRFLLDKNGSYEGVRSNTRKSFVKPVGMMKRNHLEVIMCVCFSHDTNHGYFEVISFYNSKDI